MKTVHRRWLAFAGGCLAGGALGELVNGILGAVGNFIGSNNLLLNPRGSATIWLGSSTDIWAACLALGAGVGVMIAAMIHGRPASTESVD